MKWIFFAFTLLILGCSSKQKFYGGELYKGYKDKGFLYTNDSLDFQLGYFGGSNFLLNPTPKDFAILSRILPKGIIPKFDGSVILYKKSYENDLFGISQVLESALEDEKNITLKKIKKNWLLDSMSIKMDTLSAHNLVKIYYCYHDINFKYEVIEHLIALSDKKTLKLVEINLAKKHEQFRYLLDYNTTEALKSFKFNIRNEDAEAMKNPYFYLSNRFKDYHYNYLSVIDEIRKLDRKNVILDNTIKANFFSFVGDYKCMMKYRDKEVEKFNWTTQDSLELESFALKNAKDEILKNTKNKQVVMINENHLNPYSRVFVTDLLADFKKQGFDYLGIETLVSSEVSDSILNIQKYPTQKSGYYVTEPCFGNLIRTALKENFNVFAYEYNKQSDSTSRIQKKNHREKSQALNIQKILAKDPNAKILIYAGHDHIQKKSNNPQVKMMAAYFKLLSGIEPFCIEQATMIEKVTIDKEHPAYRQIMSKNRLKESVVLERNNEYWTIPERRASHDMCVFHQRNEYNNTQYPIWLLNSTGKISHTLNLESIKTKENYLLQVYVKKEYDEAIFEAVPIINRITNKTNNTLQINLSQGEYVVLVFDKYKNCLYNKNIKIK